MSGAGSESGAAQVAQWWVDGSWQEVPSGVLTPGESPFLLAIDANEFPDLAQAIQYTDDVDGYLRAVGVSEDSISLGDEGTAGAGSSELAGV